MGSIRSFGLPFCVVHWGIYSQIQISRAIRVSHPPPTCESSLIIRMSTMQEAMDFADAAPTDQNDKLMALFQERLDKLEEKVENLKLVSQSPKYPTFIKCQTRLRSFTNGWPRLSFTPSPEQLAKAGFFYVGARDHTQCFFCGIKLRHWQNKDDPLQEHHKFSPGCEYLQMVRP